MNQQKYFIAFLSFLVIFLGSFGAYVVDHPTKPDTWELVGHICIIGASALGAMITALKYQLPRVGEYKDRVSDVKLNEINNEGSER